MLKGVNNRNCIQINSKDFLLHFASVLDCCSPAINPHYRVESETNSLILSLHCIEKRKVVSLFFMFFLNNQT